MTERVLESEGLISLTEGKGFCARRQERLEIKKMQDLIDNKDNILVFPDIDKSKHLINKEVNK